MATVRYIVDDVQSADTAAIEPGMLDAVATHA